MIHGDLYQMYYLRDVQIHNLNIHLPLNVLIKNATNDRDKFHTHCEVRTFDIPIIFALLINLLVAEKSIAVNLLVLNCIRVRKVNKPYQMSP